MTDADVARTILTRLQDAVTAKDLDRMMSLLDPAAVLVGTRLYNEGAAAIREYLSHEVADIEESLLWVLPELDVFVRTDDVIGFAGDGAIRVLPPSGDEMTFQFRLTIVARETAGRWSIVHFHGSLPSLN
jgi:ketosteroid isomerase-like protein